MQIYHLTYHKNQLFALDCVMPSKTDALVSFYQLEFLSPVKKKLQLKIACIRFVCRQNMEIILVEGGCEVSALCGQLHP